MEQQPCFRTAKFMPDYLVKSHRVLRSSVMLTDTRHKNGWKIAVILKRSAASAAKTTAGKSAASAAAPP
jgi:hypothetical protein